jgi:hypothetical protein
LIRDPFNGTYNPASKFKLTRVEDCTTLEDIMVKGYEKVLSVDKRIQLFK